MRALNEIATPPFLSSSLLPPPPVKGIGRRSVCVVETGELPITLRVRRVQSLTFKAGFIAPEHRAEPRDSKDADAKRFLVDTLCIICATGSRPVRRLFGSSADWFWVEIEEIRWLEIFRFVGNRLEWVWRFDFFVTEMDRLWLNILCDYSTFR